MSDDYDASDDGMKSYYAAVEAKRLRGDTAWNQAEKINEEDEPMNDQPKNLRDAMDAAAQAMDLATGAVNMPATPQGRPPERSEADNGVRLLQAGERLLRDRQAHLIDRTNFYHGEMQRLQDMAETELLGIRRMIERLKALRDG